MPTVSEEPGGAGAARPQVTRESLHAVIRPRRGRRVAIGIAVAETLVFSVPALLMPGSGPGAFHWGDRAGIIGLALLIAAFLYRFAQVRAVPREDGMSVHNLVRTTQLEWAQIVAVRFGGGNPWVLLDLDDGETLPVMAIQRADGAFGEAEARRLATLLALHTQTPRNT